MLSCRRGLTKTYLLTFKVSGGESGKVKFILHNWIWDAGIQGWHAGVLLLCHDAARLNLLCSPLQQWRWSHVAGEGTRLNLRGALSVMSETNQRETMGGEELKACWRRAVPFHNRWVSEKSYRRDGETEMGVNHRLAETAEWMTRIILHLLPPFYPSITPRPLLETLTLSVLLFSWANQ